jgi:aryl-alcohol dehydrogenase-like predicted oxidoreductase
MSVGKDVANVRRDAALVREAMEAGIWFHTASRYACGADYNLLGRTFAEAPGQIPPCICKIRCDNAEILRIDVEHTVRLFGLQRVDVAQLSRTARDRKDAIVEDFARQGPMWETCCELKQKGLVGNFVLEMFFGCSEDGLKAVEHEMFDGYGFYFNALNREASNELYQALAAAQCPIISIRSGGFLDGGWFERTLAERPGHRDLEMHEALVPLFRQSQCADWLEFSMRYLFSLPNVVTTVGGTRNVEHFRRHLAIARERKPLPRDIVEAILGIQDRWMGKA